MPVRHTVVAFLFTFSFSLALLLLPAGCSGDKGQTVVQWGPAQPPMVTTAKEPGKYALYLGHSTDAVVVQKLKHGERMGFEKNDVGRIRAFAGSYSTTIDPMLVEQARWQLMLPPQTQPAPAPTEEANESK